MGILFLVTLEDVPRGPVGSELVRVLKEAAERGSWQGKGTISQTTHMALSARRDGNRNRSQNRSIQGTTAVVLH